MKVLSTLGVVTLCLLHSAQGSQEARLQGRALRRSGRRRLALSKQFRKENGGWIKNSAHRESRCNGCGREFGLTLGKKKCETLANPKCQTGQVFCSTCCPEPTKGRRRTCYLCRGHTNHPQKDNNYLAKNCSNKKCGLEFDLFNRRHHCWGGCQRIFCRGCCAKNSTDRYEQKCNDCTPGVTNGGTPGATNQPKTTGGDEGEPSVTYTYEESLYNRAPCRNNTAGGTPEGVCESPYRPRTGSMSQSRAEGVLERPIRGTARRRLLPLTGHRRRQLVLPLTGHRRRQF